MFLTERPIATAGFIGSSLAIGLIISSWFVIFIAAMVAIVYLWSRSNQPTTPDQDDQRVDPEVVRQRTAVWSDPEYDSTTRQQLEPHLVQREEAQSPAVQQSTAPSIDDNESNSDDTPSSKSAVSNPSELEFRWKTNTDVSFEDVGGMSDIKQQLRRDVVKPVTTHREQAEKLGISASNIIFHGPPGTGKSYLARALASELGFPFAHLSGADVQSKWINESAQKVQTLFDEAQQIADDEGGAVVFLDELDAILKSRDTHSAHEEDTKVVNEFLNHLEATSDQNIIFIGATNRLESLDEAGIRSGRIDKKIHIGLPDRRDRREILRAQLADRPSSLSDDHLEQIAGWTQGRSAADLERLIDEAARSSLNRDDDRITWLDIRRVVPT